jgi:hypothetical protein
MNHSERKQTICDVENAASNALLKDATTTLLLPMSCSLVFLLLKQKLYQLILTKFDCVILKHFIKTTSSSFISQTDGT